MRRYSMKKIVVVLMSMLAMLVAAVMPKLFLLIMEGKLCRVKIKLTAVRLWSCIIRGQVIPRLLPE
jgi:hypothetical protein